MKLSYGHLVAILIGLALGMSISLVALHPYVNEDNKLNYSKDEMLLPSGVCTDTLIVVDAYKLDRAMKVYDEDVDMSETELNTIFHKYCRIK